MSLLSVPLKTVLMYWVDTTNEAIPAGYQVCDGTTLGAGAHDIGGGGSSYTVPDLRNRFVLGADITKTVGVAGDTANSPASAPGPQASGGIHAKQLAVTEIPGHTHTGTTASSGAHVHAGSVTDSQGAHIHTASETTAGAHSHAGSTTDSQGNHAHLMEFNGTQTGSGGHGGLSGPPPGDGGAAINYNTDTAGAHTHNLVINADGSHAHTITIASGGAHTHNLTIVSDGAHTHTFTSDSTGGGTAFDLRPRYVGCVFIMKVRN